MYVVTTALKRPVDNMFCVLNVFQAYVHLSENGFIFSSERSI